MAKAPSRIMTIQERNAAAAASKIADKAAAAHLKTLEGTKKGHEKRLKEAKKAFVDLDKRLKKEAATTLKVSSDAIKGLLKDVEAAGKAVDKAKKSMQPKTPTVGASFMSQTSAPVQ